MENIVVDHNKTQKKKEANRISSKKYREKLKEQRNEIEKERSDRLIVLKLFSEAEWRHLLLLPPKINCKLIFSNPFLLAHYHFGYPLHSLFFTLRINILKSKEQWVGQFEEIIIREMCSLCIQIEHSVQMEEYYFNQYAAIKLWKAALRNIKKHNCFTLELIECAVIEFEEYNHKTENIETVKYHKRWNIYINNDRNLDHLILRLNNDN